MSNEPRWVAGLSCQYKLYWEGDTRDEVINRAWSALGAGPEIWVVERERYDDGDAWELVGIPEGGSFDAEDEAELAASRFKSMQKFLAGKGKFAQEGCVFCGRVVLAGWCCEEARKKALEQG